MAPHPELYVVGGEYIYIAVSMMTVDVIYPLL